MKYQSTCSLVAALFFAVSAAGIAGGSTGPMSLDQLVTASERIIVGEVQSIVYSKETVNLSSKTVTAEGIADVPYSEELVFTYLTLRVTDEVAGLLPAQHHIEDSVVVRYPGGVDGDFFVWFDGFEVPDRGDLLLLFIRDANRRDYQGRPTYHIVGSKAGTFRVKQDARGRAVAVRGSFTNRSLDVTLDEGPIDVQVMIALIKRAVEAAHDGR